MSKYNTAYILSKKGNLLPYLATAKIAVGMFNGEPRPSTIESYARERNITLIAMFRYETEHNPAHRSSPKQHCICRIKCPINPLPVKGEFEAPSESAILSFLIENGWVVERKLHLRMFE